MPVRIFLSFRAVTALKPLSNRTECLLVLSYVAQIPLPVPSPLSQFSSLSSSYVRLLPEPANTFLTSASEGCIPDAPGLLDFLSFSLRTSRMRGYPTPAFLDDLHSFLYPSRPSVVPEVPSSCFTPSTLAVSSFSRLSFRLLRLSKTF